MIVDDDDDDETGWSELKENEDVIVMMVRMTRPFRKAMLRSIAIVA